MTTTLKILGITDERTACECCGRDNLKKTVALDKDGVVVYFGTECAAKAMGRTKVQVEKDIRTVARQTAEEAARERTRCCNEERAAYDSWKLATFGDIADSLDRIRQYRAAMAV
jgi:ribosome-binding protein aMBF1 (putative translation factor)